MDSKAVNNYSFILKCTRNCNLRCNYCKDFKKGSFNNYDIRLISNLFQNISSLPNLQKVNFIWHGGEPLLLGVQFFRKAYYLQNHFFGKTQFSNTVQSNGCLINEDWINHFLEYEFQVGISLDGPEMIHGINRILKNGENSYSTVMEGIEKLKKSSIPFGILTVISEEHLNYEPSVLFDFLDLHNINNYAFLSLRKEWKDCRKALKYNHGFGKFMAKAIMGWLKRDDIKINFRELNSKVDLFFGLNSSVCKDGGPCVGKYFGVESNGNVYHCDKFLNDKRFFFGNIFDKKFNVILHSKQLKDAIDIETSIRNECSACEWFNICKGGCLADLISLKSIGGKIGTKDCMNYSIYQSLSKYLSPVFNNS